MIPERIMEIRNELQHIDEVTNDAFYQVRRGQMSTEECARIMDGHKAQRAKLLNELCGLTGNGTKPLGED